MAPKQQHRDPVAATAAPAASAGAQAKTGRTKKQAAASNAGDKELDDMIKLAQSIYNEARKPGAKQVAAAAAQAAATVVRRMPTTEEVQRYVAERQRLEEATLIEAQRYTNVFMPISDDLKRWTSLGGNKWLRFEQFRDERMEDVVALFSAELSEPYSAFTYEHFLGGWPDLGILAFGVESATEPAADTVGTMVGCVVSKVSKKRPPTLILRGYIAMLAVAKSFRGHKIGQKLVRVTVDLMRQKECIEVGLETPVSNQRALDLYLDLGFAKTKYLSSYYLDGSDAVRLKLWTHDPIVRALSRQ